MSSKPIAHKSKVESIREAAKTEMEPKKLTKEEAGVQLTAFKSSYKKLSEDLVVYYRECWRFKINRLNTYYGYEDTEKFLVSLGFDKVGTTKFREACRIYSQFLSQVVKLPEFSDDHGAAEEFVDGYLDKAFKALGSNSSYLGELSRTNVIGTSKRDALDNLDEVKEVYSESKNHGEFASKVKKKFGYKSKGYDKREERKKAAAGETVSVNAKVQSTLMKPVADMFTETAKEIGVRKDFSEMTSSEIGDILVIIAKGERAPLGAASGELPEDPKARAAEGEMAIKRAFKCFFDADLDEKYMKPLMDGFMAAAESVAAKL